MLNIQPTLPTVQQDTLQNLVPFNKAMTMHTILNLMKAKILIKFLNELKQGNKNKNHDQNPEEIDFRQHYHDISDNESSSIDNTTDDYYKVELHPTPSNPSLAFIPITNYVRNTVVEDVLNGWGKIDIDEVPDHGPFTDIKSLNFYTKSC